MKNKSITKCLSTLMTILLVGATYVSLVHAIGLEHNDSKISIAITRYSDITAEEAWIFLNDTSNGIQIPIDVRAYGEWYGERIDTPFPEDPRHYSVGDLETEDGINEFMSVYNGRDIILYCRSGSRSSSAAQILTNQQFNGSIYNMLGGITAWKLQGFPTKTGNDIPNPPERPDGPKIGKVGSSYTYTTQTTDPNNDSVKYGWDWDGNGVVDEWMSSFYKSGTMVNISHTWDVSGTYTVKAKAEDAVGDQSDFSLDILVVVSNQPNIPSISGPTSGKKGETYEYTFVTTDPDNDNIYYWVQWGEGCPSVEWIGPYASGEEVTLTYSWDTAGTYTIRAQAKDVYECESEWGSLEVSMPKSFQNSLVLLLETLAKNIDQSATRDLILSVANLQPLHFSIYALMTLKIFSTVCPTPFPHMP